METSGPDPAHFDAEPDLTKIGKILWRSVPIFLKRQAPVSNSESIKRLHNK